MAENQEQQEQTTLETQEIQEETQLVPQLKKLIYVSGLVDFDTFKPTYVMYLKDELVRFVGVSKGRRVVVYKTMLFRRTVNNNLAVDHYDFCQKPGPITDVVKLTDIEFNLENDDIVIINYHRNGERRQIVVGKAVDEALAYSFSMGERLMIYDMILNFAR